MWTGRVRLEDVDAYVAYVEETGIEAQIGSPGNLSSQLVVRTVGEEAEIAVLSMWESMEAVKTFAGPRPERAVYYPEDERYLTSAPEEVTHWEVRRTARPDRVSANV
jgi:heme-degrading monooxygenase HmoA